MVAPVMAPPVVSSVVPLAMLLRLGRLDLYGRRAFFAGGLRFW